MKSLLILALLCVSCVAWGTTPDKTGVGLMLGNPTGITAKRWLSEKAAVDAGLGFSIGKSTDFNLHSDYLLHQKDAFYFNDIHPLDLYYGIGGRMEFADDIELGVRVPVGLVHNFTDQPADIFAEAAPIIDFISKTGLELSFAIGARYYFR